MVALHTNRTKCVYQSMHILYHKHKQFSVFSSLMLALITVHFPAYMKRLSVTNLRFDNFLPILWLNASVIIQANMKKVCQYL